MSDIVIKAGPFEVFISPLGFHIYASDFLQAYQGFKAKEHFSPVPYYLLCRSIELSLKGFLLAKGISKSELRRFGKNGHDLEKILLKAIEMGLGDFIQTSSGHKEAIKQANYYYASKKFEYFDAYTAGTGYKNLPELSLLDDFASLLVTELEALCLNATDGPV